MNQQQKKKRHDDWLNTDNKNMQKYIKTSLTSGSADHSESINTFKTSVFNTSGSVCGSKVVKVTDVIRHLKHLQSSLNTQKRDGCEVFQLQ